MKPRRRYTQRTVVDRRRIVMALIYGAISAVTVGVLFGIGPGLASDSVSVGVLYGVGPGLFAGVGGAFFFVLWDRVKPF